MTDNQISATSTKVGRPPINDHQNNMVLRFPPGVRERLEAVLRGDETRTSLIRALILAEIERREKEMSDD